MCIKLIDILLCKKRESYTLHFLHTKFEKTKQKLKENHTSSDEELFLKREFKKENLKSIDHHLDSGIYEQKMK